MRYRLFGLEIESDLPLALMPGAGGRPPDVSISSSRVADGHAFPKAEIAATAKGVYFTIPAVARYEVEEGRRIQVAYSARALASKVELYLLGSAMGLLLQQRGILALHANALRKGSKAIAVAAHSGSGKSTLAARLVERGLTLLSDDVCAIAMDGKDGPMALPGPPRLRLWPDALDALGIDRKGLEPVQDRAEKLNIPHSETEAVPTPFAAIYFLHRSEGDEGFARLSGIKAVEALMANTYRGQLHGFTGVAPSHFDQCVALAREIPMFDWHRRWGREYEEDNIDALLNHAAGFGLEA